MFKSPSFLNRNWVLKEPCPRLTLSLAQTLGLPESIARLLATRGVTLDQADSYLNPTLRALMPDPGTLQDMDKAVQRVMNALLNKEKIGVWGDYDVDGATSSALLVRYFQSMGVEVLCHIPDRIEEGYGLNIQEMGTLANQGIRVLITVDCGTTAFEPIEAFKETFDIIILDHHTSESTLPPAYSIVNPNRVDETPENRKNFSHLAAVGMTFLFLVSLNRALKAHYGVDHPLPDLMSFLDLVALGTVADVVPLTALNRAFVTQGLKVMKKRENVGLRTLMDTASMTQAPEAYHLGYVLGPRINAGGRVGEASLGMKLLSGLDAIEAIPMARALEYHNAQRKALEDMALEDALHQAESQPHNILILKGDDWHPGVIGIVAGRIKERFLKPTCVISFDGNLGKASGRSIPGLDLGALIHRAKHLGHLINGGGHPMAAGFTVERDKLEGFEAFLRQETENLSEIVLGARDLILEDTLPINAISADLVDRIKQVGPFGSGNPSPRFAVGPVMVSHLMPVGDVHLKITLTQRDGSRLEAIAFRAKDTELGVGLLETKGQPIYVAGSLGLNVWNGTTKVQMTVDDALLA